MKMVENKDTLFRNEYREVILCEYQRELALIKQMIEIVEEAVSSKKPIDIWNHEGFCHMFAKSIVDYTKMAYDNMQLGHFYLCLDRHKGFAIVEGSESYAVEFQYCNGEISHLICDCPCACTCKHAFAAMLQLCETLEMIEKHYSEAYECTGYLAAIAKGTLFSFAIDNKQTGSFTL